MASWIFPCNNENITYIDECYLSRGKINWYQNRKVNVGDYVFVYESSPAMTVRYKGIVTEISFYLQDNDEDTHSAIQSSIFYEGPFFEIQFTHEYKLFDLLKYSDLKNNGLNSRLMGPQHIQTNLEKYLNDVITLENDGYSLNNYIQGLDNNILVNLAKKHSTKKVKKTVVTTTHFSRNIYVAQYAKNRANGICQLCGQAAPFNDNNGLPYLESHHIVWLSNGGSDSIDNVVALCPNCHKKMHIKNDVADVQFLINKVK